MLLGQNPFDAPGVMIWSLVLVGLLLVGFIVVSLVRRRLRESDNSTSIGFTLADLRELHRDGKLTDAEFEQAKAKMTARLKAAAARQEQKNG